MEYLTSFVDFFIHLDKHLDALISHYGVWSYLILCVIIFCETGLVVTPILPGDSLLFAAGALASRGSLNVHLLAAMLAASAIIGNQVNFQIGRFLGPKVFERGDSRIFKKAYIDKTHAFFERYGGRTIIFSRFVPIVRTFAPFMAGVGMMNYMHFITNNILGAVAWVLIGLYSGYLFGEIPVIKNNFSLVVLGIVVVSLIPAVLTYFQAKSEAV